jgi:shikimate kinase
MMGAGKSSVGRRLQNRTGLPRFDTDEIIIGRAQMSIPEIFERQGEPWFRDRETEVLKELVKDETAIIVTGGGIVLRPENTDLLKQIGTVVWLDAAADTLFERASRRGNRPLLQTENPQAALSAILQARLPLYSKAANFGVDTTRLTHDEVTDAILAQIEARIATTPT